MGAEDRYDLQLGDTTQQQEDEEQEQSSTKPAHTPDSRPTVSGNALLTAMESSGGGEQPLSNTQPSGAVGGLHVPHLSTEGESEDVGEGEGEGETEEREEYLDRVESRLRRLGMKFAMDTDEEDEEVGWHSSSKHEGTPPTHQHGCVYGLTVFSHPLHMYAHTHTHRITAMKTSVMAVGGGTTLMSYASNFPIWCPHLTPALGRASSPLCRSSRSHPLAVNSQKSMSSRPPLRLH